MSKDRNRKNIKNRKFNNDVKSHIKKANNVGEKISKNYDIFSSISRDAYNKKKESLTSFILDDKYLPLTLKQIEIALNVNKNDKLVLEYTLNELENENVIYIDENKRYAKIDGSGMKKCIYDAKSRKFGFGISENEQDNDVYIPSDFSLGAMNGDTILVKVMDEVHIATQNTERKVGKVVKILKRGSQKIIGRFSKSKNFGFVQPIDSKIDDIYISKKNSEKMKAGSLVEVEIYKYSENGNRAEGKIVSIIGSMNEPNIEVKALYKSYDLDQMETFNELVLKEVDNIPDKISSEDEVGRVDRTADNIYTIDSYDAMDLDDAVSVKKQGSEYILSVYIADVSNYVKDGTFLDKEAVARGTSIYIPGTVIPMLPKKLSNGICSLNAGVKRLALAIDMTIDETGKVVKSNIFKAVINVKKKMTYQNVYKVISKSDDEVLEEYKDYIKDIDLMVELSKILNKKRNEQGSINFDLPETKVILDENSNVVDIKPYEITIANNIVEEFMLITNMTIAERFFFLQAPFIYRIHEKPDEEKLWELNELLSNYKKTIKGIKNIHPGALAKVLEEFDDEESKAVVSKFMLRTLKLARYSEECVGHFGLAAKYYCHFTSPIRRYPDLFIHRVISDYVSNNYDVKENKLSKYEKQAIKYAKSSSEMEKRSTKIERDFDSLYEAMFMKDKVGQEFDSVVSSITSFGMFVKLENTIEGLIPFDSMNDDYYIYDEKRFRLVGEKKKKVYKIGDRLKVKLLRADTRARQIDFEIVRGV